MKLICLPFRYTCTHTHTHTKRHTNMHWSVAEDGWASFTILWKCETVMQKSDFLFKWQWSARNSFFKLQCMLGIMNRMVLYCHCCRNNENSLVARLWQRLLRSKRCVFVLVLKKKMGKLGFKLRHLGKYCWHSIINRVEIRTKYVHIHLPLK